MSITEVVFFLKSGKDIRKPGFFAGAHPVAVLSLPFLSERTWQTGKPDYSDDDPHWNQEFIFEVPTVYIESRTAMVSTVDLLNM